MDEDNTPDFQDLGDLEGGDPRVFDVLENGAGDDAIDTLVWDVLGQFMGVGDEVYVLPRLIVHADVRGRVRDPGAVAGVPLSRLPPRSKLDHLRMGNPAQLFDKSQHRGNVDVRCVSSASSDSESRRAPLDNAHDTDSGAKSAHNHVELSMRIDNLESSSRSGEVVAARYGCNPQADGGWSTRSFGTHLRVAHD